MRSCPDTDIDPTAVSDLVTQMYVDPYLNVYAPQANYPSRIIDKREVHYRSPSIHVTLSNNNNNDNNISQQAQYSS